MVKTTGRVDFTRAPYRGILSEVAKEMGVTQSAISQRVKRREPVACAAVLAKVDEREREDRKARRIVDRLSAKIEGDA
jgi:predicted transcriptional regulator